MPLIQNLGLAAHTTTSEKLSGKCGEEVEEEDEQVEQGLGVILILFANFPNPINTHSCTNRVSHTRREKIVLLHRTGRRSRRRRKGSF